MSGPDNGVQGTSNKTISRRAWMKAAGATGLAGLAGCSSGDESGGGSGGGGEGGMFRLAGLNDPPSEIHFNEFNFAQRPPRGYVWSVLGEMHYGLDEGFFYPVLLDDWEYSGDGPSFTMTLKDSTWWHNDEPVTSKDLWTMCMLEYYNRTALEEGVDPDPDNFEMVDEKTLKIHLNGETNPTLLEQQLVTRRARPYSHFGDWAESIAENLDDDEHYSSVFEEMAAERIEDRIGNSLWKITDATRTEFTSEVHEGHSGADPWVEADWDGATMEFAGADRERQLAFSNQIDAVSGIDEAILNNIPDNFERFDTPEEAAFAVGVNMNIEPYDDVRVRRALMHIINRENVAANLGPNNSPVENVTGISATEDVYIDDPSRYPAYENDLDKAAQLLEDAGLSKEGGTWYLEDGSEWEIGMTFAPFVEGGHTISSQLEQFGISNELETIEGGQFWGEIWPNIAEEGIEMWPLYWGGWRPYPTNGLGAALTGARHDNIGYPGFEDNGGEVEVPMPIGEFDGDTETINVVDLMSEVSGSGDTERNKEILQKLGWVFATTLPELPMTKRFSVSWIDGQKLDVPGEDSPHRLCNIPNLTLPETGDITPAE